MSHEYNDGIAFRFEIPNEDLSLRGVCIEEDQPVLLFDVAKKVPTLTEQEVAMCIRVVNDNEHPGFFYSGFLPDHPLAGTGRHFKYYKPLYMRRTPMGENLAEIDWNMKCLSVDVRTDKAKKFFFSWSENSNIDGLKSFEHFGCGPKNLAFYMKCKSVTLFEGSDQFMFHGEPKMMINNERCQSYSSYITEHFDSVAYYDEPLFLKMKEYIKLILVAEWLKKKKIHFSQEWIQEQTKPTLEPPKPLQVELSPEERNSVVQQLKKGVKTAVEEESQLKQILPSSKYEDRISVSEPVVKVDSRGFEVTYERTLPDPFFEFSTGVYVPVVQKVVSRATTHDLDFLYSDINPNRPVIFDFGTMGLINPKVKTWSELMAETEVMPCKWWQDPDDIMHRSPALIGGVSTTNIPVRRVSEPVPVKNPCPIKVPASKKKTKKKVHSRDIPTQHTVQAPPSTASVTTSAVMPAPARNIKYGYETASSSSGMSNGEKITQSPLHTHTTVTEVVHGKVRRSLNIPLHCRLPPRAEPECVNNVSSHSNRSTSSISNVPNNLPPQTASPAASVDSGYKSPLSVTVPNSVPPKIAPPALSVDSGSMSPLSISIPNNIPCGKLPSPVPSDDSGYSSTSPRPSPSPSPSPSPPILSDLESESSAVDISLVPDIEAIEEAVQNLASAKDDFSSIIFDNGVSTAATIDTTTEPDYDSDDTIADDNFDDKDDDNDKDEGIEM